MNLKEFRIAIDLLGFKPSLKHPNIFRIIISPQITFTISMSDSDLWGISIRNKGIRYTDPKIALKNIVERIKVEKLRAERVDEIMLHLP